MMLERFGKHCHIRKSGQICDFPDRMLIGHLKKAEKSNDLILRLVEDAGMHSTARLFCDPEVKKVTAADLLEWHRTSEILPEPDGSRCLELKPFEIVTLALTLQQQS